MNPLDQAFLSRLAPYTVVLIDDEYCFRTDSGVEYAVAFNPEPSFGGLPAYWFDLSNRSGKASPNDPKVRETVIYTSHSRMPTLPMNQRPCWGMRLVFMPLR